MWRYYFKKIRSVPIYIKITGLFVGIIILLEFGTIASLYVFFNKQGYSHFIKFGRLSGNLIAYRVEDYLPDIDIPGLKKILNKTVLNGNIVYAFVKNKNGRIIAYSLKNGYFLKPGKYNIHDTGWGFLNKIKSPHGNIVKMDIPIWEETGQRIGTLMLGLFYDGNAYFMHIAVTLVLFTFIPLIILIVIFFRWILLSVLSPLSDLTDAANMVKNGNYSIAVKQPEYVDEKLSDLIKGFNNMASQLNRLRQKREKKDLRRNGFIREIIKAQEEERNKISRELHDELAQFLVFIRMKFGMLENLNNAALIHENIKGIRERTMHELSVLNNITKELRPGLLYELGLEKAVRQYAAEIESNHGIKFEIYSIDMKDLIADQYVEVNLYRIIQESFLNIVRHSGASTAKVIMNYEKGIFRAVIEDDGIGFKYKGKVAGNFGINGMRERAELLGGTFDLKSEPGLGVIIDVNVPIKQSDLEREDKEPKEPI